MLQDVLYEIIKILADAFVQMDVLSDAFNVELHHFPACHLIETLQFSCHAFFFSPELVEIIRCLNAERIGIGFQLFIDIICNIPVFFLCHRIAVVFQRHADKSLIILAEGKTVILTDLVQLVYDRLGPDAVFIKQNRS